jgi:hypothetical protein
MNEITTKEAGIVVSNGVSANDHPMLIECRLYPSPYDNGYSASIRVKKYADGEYGEEILLPEKNIIFLAKSILAYYEKI